MASNATPPGDFKFDMRQNVETWRSFNKLALWVIILSAITLMLMAAFLTGK
jgi:hypothetical protein